MTAEGVVGVIADVSAPMTSDQWARAAVDLAVDLGGLGDRRGRASAPARPTSGWSMMRLRRAKLNRPIRVTTWPPGR